MAHLMDWTYSKMDDYNYCILRGYLRWVEGVRNLTVPAFIKGGLLHSSIEHFWKKLGTEEEARKTRKKKDGKKYWDARSFADYLSGKWISRIIAAEQSEMEIQWAYPNQRYHMGPKIRDIAFYLFPYLFERGKPPYSEIPFRFILGHRRFKGKIDEIRVNDGKIIVTDFKSGSPSMGEIKRDHDSQMTMYNVGLGSLCYADEKFAKSLGLEGIRKTFFGHPKFVNEAVEHEFVMLEAPYVRAKLMELEQKKGRKANLPEVSLKTSRRENHFYEILKMLDGVEASLKSGIIYPQTGHKCDYCSMKTACKTRLEQLTSPIPMERNGQEIMSFAAPLFKRPVEREDIEIGQLNFFEKIADKISIRRRVKKANKSLIVTPS